MKLYLSFPKNLPRTALTIGTFDGVHLGHQSIFKRMQKLSPHTTVLTFLNHPCALLKPPAPPLLTHFPLKLSLLASFGIDAIIALPFTSEFASLTYDALLQNFDLSHLVLGADSAFGKHREGTPSNIQRYAKGRSFTVEYLPKFSLDNIPISSSRIRKAIISGDLALATRLLGRPYSIPYPLPPTPLVLPPSGTYPILIDNTESSLTLHNGQIEHLAAPEKSGIIHFKLKDLS